MHFGGRRAERRRQHEYTAAIQCKNAADRVSQCPPLSATALITYTDILTTTTKRCTELEKKHERKRNVLLGAISLFIPPPYYGGP